MLAAADPWTGFWGSHARCTVYPCMLRKVYADAKVGRAAGRHVQRHWHVPSCSRLEQQAGARMSAPTGAGAHDDAAAHS